MTMTPTLQAVRPRTCTEAAQVSIQQGVWTDSAYIETESCLAWHSMAIRSQWMQDLMTCLLVFDPTDWCHGRCHFHPEYHHQYHRHHPDQHRDQTSPAHQGANLHIVTGLGPKLGLLQLRTRTCKKLLTLDHLRSLGPGRRSCRCVSCGKSDSSCSGQKPVDQLRCRRRKLGHLGSAMSRL